MRLKVINGTNKGLITPFVIHTIDLVSASKVTNQKKYLFDLI